MLDSLITSKTRLRFLIKFLNIANKGYLNGLANEFGESTNSVKLNNLSSAGYLESTMKTTRLFTRQIPIHYS